MYEVEVKVRASLEPVRDQLPRLDAHHHGRVRQVDTYYEHPQRSLADTDEALRIRRQQTPTDDIDAFLTYKGPLVETASKTREEVETSLGDAAAMDAALQALGFDPAAVVEKDREQYTIDEYAISLDRVEDLGEFVEIEATGVESEIDTLRSGARDLLSRLGLDPDEHIRASYLELLLDAQP